MTRRIPVRAMLVGLLLTAGLPAAARAADPPAPAPAVPAPANDARADAATVTALPAGISGTTLGATVELREPFTTCGCAGGSLWYRYVATTDGRIVVALAAAGDLDAVVDAFTLTRSQLSRSLAEQTTDKDGKASISFAVKAGQTILVRVAQRDNSVPGAFRLTFDAAAPAVRFPGARLAPAGVTATLDAVLRPQAIVSSRMVPGRAYRIAISPIAVATSGADDAATVQSCRVRLELIAPGARDRPVKRLGCDGYVLFTPGRGEGGLYSLRTTVPDGVRGAQRYHLQVAPATANDTAPGVFLANHQRVRGTLQGTTANRVDLYRFTITRRSMLKLTLTGAGELALILRTDAGRPVAAPGAGNAIARDIAPGRYYVAVTAPAGAAGHYTLIRSSRTITRTSATFAGAVAAHAKAGARVAVGVRVRPAAAGLARITLERLDPIAGWQYLRTTLVRVRRGRAAAAFAPPSVGRYRARVEYLGTRDTAESVSGYANLLVTGNP